MSRTGSLVETTFSTSDEELLSLLLAEEGIEVRNDRAISPRGAGGAVPLSFAQQRLWLLAQLEPDSPFYNLPKAVRLRGGLDTAALERSLNEIVSRHEILRTTFADADGSPVQVVVEPRWFELPLEDLSGLPEPEREAEARRRAAEETRRVFDLERGPLFRARLLRLAAEDHVLLFTMHHIVSDAWSTGVLIYELSALYRAFASGHVSPLPDLPVQYADYAVWQRGRLQGELLERQLDFWRARLKEVPVLELPTDRPRPAMQTFNGAVSSRAFDGEATARLKELSERERVSLFTTLLAAFKTLLSRYCAQADIVVGTPVAGRDQAESEGLIGFFVNMLALRTDLSGDPTFTELLARVREVSVGAQANQDLPFERLVEELQPERNLNHNPLFQVVFAHNVGAAAAAGAALSELSVESLEVETGTSKFDLILTTEETAHGLTGSLQYNTDLFDASTAERLLDHFSSLLCAVATDPSRHLSRFELLTEGERRRLLVEWNDTAAEYPRSAGVHELFEERAARKPDAVAVVFEGGRLTYGELNARANRLARHLLARGVVAETPVGVLAGRSADTIVCLLAVLKAGGAYVPLDPSYPSERLAWMMRDAGVRVALTRGQTADAVCAGGLDVVDLDEAREEIARQGGENLGLRCDSLQLAYVMYTSGSTGTPKGIGVPHRGIVRLVRGSDFAHFNENEVFLQLAPISFDASTFELWGALLNGAVCVLYEREVPTAAELGRVIRRHNVTTMWLTASLFNAVVSEGVSELRGLRQLLAGGEALSVPHVELVLNELPGLRLINGYGPTENTTFTCCHTIEPGSTTRAAGVPIGQPIANTRVYILDAEGRPTPVGLVGELYAGGDGLARGYLNRSALTAERFVPDPFALEPGARLYRTGDRARYLPNGEVEFLGRLDNQVKIRGFRIEPGEVEAALAAEASVRECAVVVREDAPGDKRLVAYVVAAEGAQELAASEPRTYLTELRASLKGRLPEYMIPSAFVALDALPLTPNGKIDRKALPAPESLCAELKESYAAPRTPVEELVANVWADVLGVERVGIHHNFFELGGHSLLATQALTRTRTAVQAELTLRSLFESPTVAAWSAVIEKMMKAGRGLDEPPMGKRPEDVDPPLSFAQQRLWFVDKVNPGNPAYNVPLALRLQGRLDINALELSLSEIVRRHETLRTSFALVEGQPVQLVAPPAPLPLPLIDVQQLTEAEREVEAEREAEREAREPFDLGGGPLLRARLLRLGGEDHVVLLTMHHIVSDGWSMGVLVREVAALYEAFSKGEPSPLAELPLQYADFAVWQRGWLQGEVLEGQLAYWRGRLAGAPRVLELPTDRPRPAVQSFNGSAHQFTLPADVSRSLKDLGRGAGATLFMTLLAAFQLLMSRYSQQEEVVIGSPIANRNREEVEGLIGFFVNTLALRTDLSGDPTFTELLARVREVTLSAYAHQDVPFEKLIEELQPERSLSHAPLFQVMFALQNFKTEALELPGLTLQLLEHAHHTVKFDLTCNLGEVGEEIVGVIGYNTDLFDASTVERMASHFTTLLRGVVADPRLPLSRLPLLGDDERRQLTAWGEAEVVAVEQLPIHELFERQAALTPDAVAVVARDSRLTYAELNRRANQLAHRLRRLGVGRGVSVGLCAARSAESVIGMLGTWKAGGVYVPLDPEHPPERVAFMLEDAQVKVLLTQSSLASSLPQGSARVLCLDETGEAHGAVADVNPPGVTTPADAAYLIFTSGTTGKPKAVVAEHRNLVNTIVTSIRQFNFDGADVMPVLAPFVFDISLFELLMPLLAGGTALVLDRTQILDMPSLLTSLNAVTSLHAVPSLMRQVVAAARDNAAADLSRMRLLFVGGDVVSTELLREMRHTFPSARVHVLYGPTEASIICLSHGVEADAADETRNVIGRPLGNVLVKLCDARGSLLPAGVSGEIYIGGAGVTRGYLNRAELTAEKFVLVEGRRYYRSGDLGRYLPDGRIEFLGRVDGQVKIRGHRIELGEIEMTLGAHPSLCEAVVLAQADEVAGRRLVAYFVSRQPDALPSVGELRAFLGAALPEYMIPSVFVPLDELPLTPNGKVDRKALPALGHALHRPEKSYVAPRSEAERKLVIIWQEALRLEQVGAQDNFFELGGHSLLMVQVHQKVREAFAREVSIVDLFRYPTIDALAGFLSNDGAASQPPAPIQRDRSAARAELLKRQGRLRPGRRASE